MMEKHIIPASFTFYSGGANGSDIVWEKVANEYKANFFVMSFKGNSLKKKSLGLIELTPNQLEK